MSFENRLGALLKDEDPYAAGPDPVPIMAAARRRRARRRAATGAAAFAVVLVCGATAVTAGNARHAGEAARAATTPSTALPAAPAAGPGASPSAVPSAAPSPVLPAAPSPVLPAAPSAVASAVVPAVPNGVAPPEGLSTSPVKQLAPGEKVEIITGVRLSVTPTESCHDALDRTRTAYTGPVCTDMEPLVRRGVTDIDAAYFDTPDRFVVTSYYLGPTPARIVVFEDGRPTVATLLTTAGAKGWLGYYAIVPAPAPAGGSSVPTVAAYDADGRLLAARAGRTADGAPEQPPVRL
ncbi:hypothetical protein [Kitasatospora sp. NPDC018619]|uniref:hypothetical protein n=1 Tax=unclassified Kitasatospora TaxID=2633591 RepID=UPI0037B349F0